MRPEKFLTYAGPVPLLELAWAAGFIDGEGYFAPKSRQVVIHQVERAPLDRIQRALGGTVNGPYPGGTPNASPILRYLSSAYDAAWILAVVVPLMSDGLKRRQAEARMVYAAPEPRFASATCRDCGVSFVYRRKSGPARVWCDEHRVPIPPCRRP